MTALWRGDPYRDAINKKRNMESTRKAARVAGFWYFVSSLPTPFALIYVPSVFMVMEGPN